jgi:hypothetical protein
LALLLLLLLSTTLHVGARNRATGLLWIYDAEKTTPVQALVRDDPVWRAAADKLKMPWLVLERQEAEREYPRATRHAEAKGLPAIVFLNRRLIPDVEKAPATGLGVIALLETRAGGLP